jgi:hypothetical protein
MSEFTSAARRPRTIPIPDVADDLGISEAAVRRAIADDTAEQLPDDRRRIPGGRVQGATFYVIARPYELVTGHLPHPTELVKRRAS